MRKYFMILAVAGVSLLFLSQFQVADRFYGGAELMKPQPYVLNERRVA